MDVRIGVTYTAKEISLELASDADRDDLKSTIEKALADESSVLWLTDKNGKEVAVPAAKVAYVEIGGGDNDRSIGFGGS